MNMLFLGDVVGKGGRTAVKKLLPDLKREFNAQFAVVNGENSAAGSGLSGSCVRELLEAAELIAKAHQAGDALGLSQEELAFYDALTRPQAIKDFYENETLVAMTRELTEMLRKNRTIDWQKKETARATMRKMVKRLLKKYKYPPEQYEDAIETVISQCEMWTDNYEN